MDKRARWTKEMIDYLVAHFPTKKNRELAEELGVSYGAIISRAYRLELKKECLGIRWTGDMVRTLRLKFATTFNRELAEEIGISLTTLIRKARELHLEKEPGFLDKNREKISRLATKALPEPWNKGISFTPIGMVPFQFKKGNVPAIKNRPEVREKVRRTRNELIRIEKIRLRNGLWQKTRIPLKNIYD